MLGKINKYHGGSFLDLECIHEHLQEIFLAHQEALILQDVTIAEELLDDYKSQIHAHIRYEEQKLLPIYESRRDQRISIRASGARIYTLEHKKILTMLDDIKARLFELVSHDCCRIAPQKIIAIFDQESVFKHLVEHHDMREHEILYPSLDQLTSPKERLKLMKQCLPRPS